MVTVVRGDGHDNKKETRLLDYRTHWGWQHASGE